MSPETIKHNGHAHVTPLRSVPPAERFTPLTPHLAISPTVSVVVPALNEAENLPHVFATLPHWIDEIVLVDGNSVDDTVAVARRLRPNVRIVTQRGKGKGDALAAGFAACTGDIIVMIDADGSTDGREIIQFVGALVTGADFVKGSRFLNGGGSDDLTYNRQLGNKVLTRLVNMIYGSRYSDLCYGYNAFWARHLDVIGVDCDGFEVETLMNIRAHRAGLRVHEVPSHERVRLHGTSNLRVTRDGIRVLRTILREWRRRPPEPAAEPAAAPAADQGAA
ncbi:glycosyltransferase family 2 protein [Spongiactinospora sp. TRM90649]|uniref:glycosyltransferase family 2 protein n=1 Tax=Spongiactinospora sp. TRM90649 TaxID=3031114 RepID=UPI0023F7E4D8|nr:glycosyltransferase family 2 protein [Spongiactinospora sp. TRM90649]MDF5757260.1 glycosyltransferase family 2 protein [Spongiactinospora sp. TRM90649]